MELEFILMRKDEPITMAVFDESGTMLAYSQNIRNIELAPLQDRYRSNWLKEWWKERSIPIGQGRISQYLHAHGYSLPSEYLIKNLGLSLTDYYWIKPLDSDLKWKDVNLFDNTFTDNLLTEIETDPRDRSGGSDTIAHFSPNSSLQGSIEKTWTVRNGERYLIKGNRSNLSAESINEVIASEIHRRQGCRDYASYELVRIRHSPYDYGCCSRLFTSQRRELVSGFAVYTYEKKPNDVSPYNHFLNMCGLLGADVDSIRKDLEYQILTDFIISGYDRHLNNIALIRDADTLRFIGTAPIFDSGGSFFANHPVPADDKELLDIETNSFCSHETGLLKLVTDPMLIDLDKLPSASYIRQSYLQDSQADKARIDRIVYSYERKIDFARDIQLGNDPTKRFFPVSGSQI